MWTISSFIVHKNLLYIWKICPSAQDLAKDTNEKRKRREFEKERQLSR
jgi:hypothetical protein